MPLPTSRLGAPLVRSVELKTALIPYVQSTEMPVVNDFHRIGRAPYWSEREVGREPFTAVEVRAHAEKAAAPPRVFTDIKLQYRVAGNVTRKAVEDAVRLSEEKYCSVAAMLNKTARISYEIHLDKNE